MTQDQTPNAPETEKTDAPAAPDAPANAAAPAPESVPSPAPEKKERKVLISSKALVRLFDKDGKVTGEEMVPRNTYTLSERLKTYDPSATVGIYLVEDEEQSEPPAEGEKRYAMPLFPPDKDPDGNPVSTEYLTVMDALARLAAATTPDQVVLAKLHQDCDQASATSHYDCGMYTMIFSGRPCGFAYLNSCRDVPVASLALLYETAKSQVENLKEQLRKLAPGIKFSDDPEPEKSGLVLPSGLPVEERGHVVAK